MHAPAARRPLQQKQKGYDRAKHAATGTSYGPARTYDLYATSSTFHRGRVRAAAALATHTHTSTATVMLLRTEVHASAW
jgi:hypothetical protein